VSIQPSYNNPLVSEPTILSQTDKTKINHFDRTKTIILNDIVSAEKAIRQADKQISLTQPTPLHRHPAKSQH